MKAFVVIITVSYMCICRFVAEEDHRPSGTVFTKFPSLKSFKRNCTLWEKPTFL